MDRYIRLRDLRHIPTPDNGRYTADQLCKARRTMEARNLKYDNATGQIIESRRIVEEYSNPRDHVPHATVEDVMRWEFKRYIHNSASRISRGLEP